MSQTISPTVAVVGGSSVQGVVEFNAVNTVERGALVTFQISLTDKDSGPIAVGLINITGISAELFKSTGGGAFSSVGIAQPTFTKSTGVVSVNYLFVAGECAAADGWKLQVSGITYTIGVEAVTAYVPTHVWSGVVLDHSDVVEDVNDIRATAGQKTDVIPAMSAASDGTQTIVQLARSIHELVGQTPADPDDSLHTVLGQRDAAALGTGTADDGTQTAMTLLRGLFDRLGELNVAAATGDPGTTTTLAAYAKQAINVLIGTDGVATWPAAAAPGNGVSFAEALRKVYDDLTTLAAALAIGGTVTGTADAGSTAGQLRDAALTQADDTFNGQLLVMTSGLNAGLSSVIVDFVAATDDVLVEPDFPSAIAAGDTYTILPRSTNADILIGHNNANNAADTSAVVANRDGSVLERAEEIADDADAILVDTGDGTNAAVAPGVAGSIHAHVREAQENIDTVQTEVNKIGAAADASATPGAAGSVHAHVREAQDNLDTIETKIGANSDASTDPSAASGTVFGKVRGLGDGQDTIVALHAVPGADVTTNTNVRDVAGNKTDAAATGDPGTTKSLTALAKQIVNVLMGADGIATFPAAAAPGNGVSMAEVERQIYNDLNAGTLSGTADAGSSASLLVDAALTHGNDYWNGHVVVLTSGANIYQATMIVDFDAATDTATLEPAFLSAIAAGDAYTILPTASYAAILIGADNANNAASTTNVVANRDGSVLERAEELANDTDAILVDTGDGADAAVAPGIAGSLHGHVREAQANIDTLETKIDVIDGFHDVPTADVTTNAQVRDVAGNKSDAATSGDVGATKSLMAYAKQLVNVLVSSVGIPSWPASSAPGNNIPIASVIRKIYDLVVAGGTVSEAVGPYTYTTGTTEQTVYESALVTRRKVSLEFNNTAMTQAGTFRLYRKVDGITYDLYGSTAVLASGNRAFDSEFTTNQHYKLTYQAGTTEGFNRDIAYSAVWTALE